MIWSVLADRITSKFLKAGFQLNLTWFILEYFVSIDHLILLLFSSEAALHR